MMAAPQQQLVDCWFCRVLQGSPMLPPYIFQQQPEVLFTPQVVNLNPQIGGPFGPQGPQFMFPTNQGNQQPHLNPVILPNGQQDQLGPLDPNTATGPMQPMQPHNPVQVGSLWSCHRHLAKKEIMRTPVAMKRSDWTSLHKHGPIRVDLFMPRFCVGLVESVLVVMFFWSLFSNSS